MMCDLCEREGVRGFIVENNPVMTAYGMDYSNILVYCKAEKACERRQSEAYRAKRYAKEMRWTAEEVDAMKERARNRFEVVE